MSDANVVSVLDSIGEGEMDAAQLAQKQASDPEVQAFAGRVLSEHRQLAEANGRLATQLSLQPDPPSLVSHLKQAHEKAMRDLRAMSGASVLTGCMCSMRFSSMYKRSTFSRPPRNPKPT